VTDQVSNPYKLACSNRETLFQNTHPTISSYPLQAIINSLEFPISWSPFPLGTWDKCQELFSRHYEWRQYCRQVLWVMGNIQ
jgi:hypothetical protein